MDMESFDRIAAEDYLGDLHARTMSEIRAMRSDCQRLEDAVSYLRRLVQGRLDIVRAEAERRAGGSPPSDVAELVAALPHTLGDRVVSGGLARPRHDLTIDDDPALTAELDAVCDTARLARLPDLDDETLRDVQDRLADLERDVSGRRRLLFDRLDALSAELTRRYRTGEATVDSLLR